MNNISSYISERLKINNNTDFSQSIKIIAKPKDRFDLRQEINKVARKSNDELDLRHIDVSQVEDMYELFLNVSDFKIIDISGWKFSKCKTVQFLFESCKAEKIYMNDVDMSNVENFHGMFYDCTSLKTIEGLEYIDTSKANNMRSLFNGCERLENIDISFWDLSNVETTRLMFGACKNITHMKSASLLKLKKCKDFARMFSGCSKLKFFDNIDDFIKLIEKNSSQPIIPIFAGCHNLNIK